MRTVTAVATQLAHQHRTGQVQAAPEVPKALNEEAARHVNDIFRALQGAFPAWRSAFPDDTSLRVAKATWVKGLMAAGVTDLKQIARGVERARLSESDFFPSVGKFIGWCRMTPEELGLPSEDQAWREVTQHSHHVLVHEWTHPGIYESGRRLGWFEIRNCSSERELAALRKAFAGHYASVLRDIERGTEFKTPAPNSNALEHHRNGRQVTTEKSKTAGRAALASLRASMGMSHG